LISRSSKELFQEVAHVVDWRPRGWRTYSSEPEWGWKLRWEQCGKSLDWGRLKTRQDWHHKHNRLCPVSGIQTCNKSVNSQVQVH